MGRLARSRKHAGSNPEVRKHRLKRRTKDLDQIHQDLAPGAAEKLLNQPIDPDLPGLGQHYCIECAYVVETGDLHPLSLSPMLGTV